MQSAPWTNASSSTGQAACTPAISFRDISLDSTTRAIPASYAARTPAGVWSDIWVDACMGIPGAHARASKKRPISCTRTASTGRVQAYCNSSSAGSSSFSCKSVFRAR